MDPHDQPCVYGHSPHLTRPPVPPQQSNRTYNVVGKRRQGPRQLLRDARDDAVKELDEEDDNHIGHPSSYGSRRRMGLYVSRRKRMFLTMGPSINRCGVVWCDVDEWKTISGRMCPRSQ